MSGAGRDAQRVGQEVAQMFLGGGGKRKRPRAKPHRCLGCGKVSKHIFCQDTYDECRALYAARPKRGQA